MGKKDPTIVTVEQKHIDTAMPEVSSKCMVAEAIRTSIPGSLFRHVDMQTIRYTDAEGVRRTYLTPSSVQAALVRFDAGDPVEPFAFRLPRPIHVSKPTRGTNSGAKLVKADDDRSRRTLPRTRVGGPSVPVIRTLTRRRFGIRRLRINQEGKVVQTGLFDSVE